MKPRRVPQVVRLLFIVDLAMCAVYGLDRLVAPGSDFLWHLVDLNAEGNLPTWFSSGQLGAAGVFLLLTLPMYPKQTRGHWGLLAIGVLLLLLSLDEVAQVHEAFGRVADRYFLHGSRQGTAFAETGLWMLALVPAVLLWLAWFIRPLLGGAVRSKAVRRLGFLGFAILLGAAGGVELLSNFIGKTPAAHVALSILEEGGEMLGGTLLFWAALLVWRGNRPDSPSRASRA